PVDGLATKWARAAVPVRPHPCDRTSHPVAADRKSGADQRACAAMHVFLTLAAATPWKKVLKALNDMLLLSSRAASPVFANAGKIAGQSPESPRRWQYIFGTTGTIPKHLRGRTDGEAPPADAPRRPGAAYIAFRPPRPHFPGK